MLTVNERIRAYRKNIGMSVPELARMIGVDKSTVFRYEQVGTKIKRTALVAVAGALDIPVEALERDDKDDELYEIIYKPAHQKKDMKRYRLGETVYMLNDGSGRVVTESEMSRMRRNSLLSEPNTPNEDALNRTGSPDFPIIQIPILGEIRAGLPLYAEQQIQGYTYCFFPIGEEYFALRVAGDSMDLAHIFDGSLIIVRRQSVVDNGELAVVGVDDDCATVKRFYRNGNIITLMPQSSNPIHVPQVYNTRQTRIQVYGRVIQIQITV